MAKRETKRQPSLLDSWSASKKKKCPVEEVVLLANDESGNEAESCLPPHVSNEDSLIEIQCRDHLVLEVPTSDHSSISAMEEVVLAEESPNELVADSTPMATESDLCATRCDNNNDDACQAVCCSNINAIYQPSDKETLANLANQGRNFMVNWYKRYPWLTVCRTKNKVFCIYCRYAEKQKMLTFSKRNESTFTTTGYSNWKKALEKFKNHSLSISHHEAEMKWNISQSCYKDDFNFNSLKNQLPLLVDVIKNAAPQVKKVTSVRTISEAMNVQKVYKEMLSEVHSMLRLYLTVPISSATSDRTFSALKRVFTYLRSSMTEKRLNNCLLLHIHKETLDSCDVVEVAKEFISAKEERRKYFGSFSTDLV